MFVGNPWLDFKAIYNLDYYRGAHGDGSIDYLRELQRPAGSLRAHEYRGLLKAATRALGRSEGRWLDYGCGNGALIPWLGAHSAFKAEGFDDGAISALARSRGIPILRRRALARRRAAYDVVTAIEVIEHHPEPLRMLREIRGLLKPGGLLLLSTGNAGPWRRRLLRWSYAQAPDVHIGFFSPRSLGFAYARAGLKSFEPGFGPGSTEIIRYKVLKSLGFRRDAAWLRWLPWGLAARLVDAVYRQSRMPWARRPR